MMQTVNSRFTKINVRTLQDNPFSSIGDDWMLITPGTAENFNTMTASWGTLGILWNKPVAICFIRPTRYSFELANRHDIITLSFFTQEEKSILQFCGTKSGRDTDKIKETGLIPLSCDNQGVGFDQAKYILECKKVYFDDIKPGNFLLSDTDNKIYPKKDYHRMYVGEILNCYIKK